LSGGKLTKDLTIVLRDPNQLVSFLPELKHTLESLTLP